MQIVVSLGWFCVVSFGIEEACKFPDLCTLLNKKDCKAVRVLHT